jgi:hypothetical protein
MLRIRLRFLVSFTPALVLPITAAAQTLGLPASYNFVTGGVGAALETGGDRLGVRTIGATGIIALGHVTADSSQLPLFDVSATVASISSDSAEAAGSAFGVDVSLLGSFKLGVDHSTRGDVRRTHIPLAAALPLFACASAKGIVELYGVPVWNVVRVGTPGGASWRHPWGSGSIGAFAELRSGLGFQLAAEGPFHKPTADPYHRWIVGFAVHFSPHGILESVPAGEKGGGCAFAL